ncbi:hypothetical protein ACQSAK_28700 [Klebsiella pneumoniae]
MRLLLITLSGLLVFGCSAIPNNEDTKAVKAIETIPHSNKTNIFYYYVDPNHYGQAMGFISGTLEWKDNCIYLVKNGEYRTATFPELPQGLIGWEESTKTLSLDNRTFKMGDYINTNGSYTRYIPNTDGAAYYDKQGDKKCLTPYLAQIGTLGLDEK